MLKITWSEEIYPTVLRIMEKEKFGDHTYISKFKITWSEEMYPTLLRIMEKEKYGDHICKEKGSFSHCRHLPFNAGPCWAKNYTI